MWITNYRDVDKMNDSGGAICIECRKLMHRVWNTVCYTCGDTSCYEHSIAVEGRWYCIKDDPSLELEFRQTIPGWCGEPASCFRNPG